MMTLCLSSDRGVCTFTNTDSGGRFAFLVPPNVYDVDFYVDLLGSGSVSARIDDIPVTGDVVADVVLPQPMARVNLTVVDSGATPVLGASIWGIGGTVSSTTSSGVQVDFVMNGQGCTTDGSGSCTATAPLGEAQRIRIDPPDMLPTYVDVDIDSDPTDVMVTLPDAPVSVSGTVRDAAGIAQSGPQAMLCVANDTVACHWVETDSAGHYSMHVPPGIYDLAVTGLSTDVGTAITARIEDLAVSDDDVVVDVTTPATVDVHMTVLDQDSNPSAAVGLAFGPGQVLDLTSEGHPIKFSAYGRGCSTDASGQCTATVLLGSSSPVTVREPGRFPWTVEVDAVADPTHATITRPDYVTLSGTVRDAAGEPLEARFSVCSSRFGGCSGWMLTDSSGEYSALIPRDIYNMIIDAPTGFSIRYYDIDISGDLVLDVTLPESSDLQVTVLDATGSPVEGARVLGGDISPLASASATPAFTSSACSTDAFGTCSKLAPRGMTTSPRVVPPVGFPIMFDVHPTLSSTSVTVQLPYVAQFRSEGAASGDVAIATRPDTELADVDATPVIGNTLPSGAVVLAGRIAYEIHDVDVGGAIDVEIALAPGSAPTSVYKIVGSAYVDVSSMAVIDGDHITLHLTDGGPGDEDSVANGVIVDPVVPARAVSPGAPSGVTASPLAATASTGNVTVSWTAPLKNGGKPVSGYVVTPYLGTVASTPRTFNSTATTQTITGLKTGKTYTFKVAAKNAIGTGARSAPSAPVVVGAPTAPVVSAISSSGKASVSWSLPSSNGATITSYVVKTYLGSTLIGSKSLTCVQPCSPARSTSVSGLSNGKLYTFKVAAVNARGIGPAGSTAVTVSATGTKPGTPTGVKAVAGVGKATVSWVAPSNGSATISGYVVTPFKNGVAQTPRSFTSTATSQAISGLTAGAPYTFKVAAKNVVGTGLQSVASNIVKPT
jgi:hypothetical protein